MPFKPDKPTGRFVADAPATAPEVPATTPMGDITGYVEPMPAGKPSDMSFQKGLLKSVSMAPFGLPGEIEALARRLPSVTPLSKETVLPTTAELTTGLYGKPETPAEAGGRAVGEVIGPVGAPKPLISTAKGLFGLGGAVGRGVSEATRSLLGTPTREATAAAEQLRQAVPQYTQEARQIIGAAETAESLAERARRTRQQVGLREAEKKFTTAAQQERETAARKFADLGTPADTAKLGDDMQRRLLGTEFTREARRSQAAARSYAEYFKQAEGFEKSTPRTEMIQRLKSMSESASEGSAGRKYAAQALKDLEESTTAFGAEKEFRKYFEQASAPQQVGYGAIEQDANRRVSEIIGEALNKHAPKRIEARKEYAEYSTPLQAYETLFGAKGVAREPAVQDLAKMMPSDYAGYYFKNRDTIDVLRKQLAGDEAAVRKFANQHAVNELSGKDAAQARKWLSDNASWVNTVEGLNTRVGRYVAELERREAAAATKEVGAKKLGEKAEKVGVEREKAQAKIAETAQKQRDELTAKINQLELQPTEGVAKSARQVVQYMRNQKPPILPESSLAALEAEINAVDKAYAGAEKARQLKRVILTKAGLATGFGGGVYGAASFLSRKE